MLTIILNLLAKHQDVQEKLLQEIAKVPNPLQYESLQSNQYLNAVIKETLRLYPPAPIIPPRRAVETIQLGTYSVQKDVQYSTYFYNTWYRPMCKSICMHCIAMNDIGWNHWNLDPNDGSMQKKPKCDIHIPMCHLVVVPAFALATIFH